MRSFEAIDNWGSYPRRAVEAEYLSVLRFDDEFEVELGVEHVGTTSITYGWEIRRPGGEVCIRGRHTAVHVDADGRPSPVSPQLRSALG